MDRLDLTRARRPIMDNWFLADEQTAIDEAMEFRNFGGGTLVELTSIGIRRDPVAHVSRVPHHGSQRRHGRRLVHAPLPP